jgi:hypothetical protein
LPAVGTGPSDPGTVAGDALLDSSGVTTFGGAFRRAFFGAAGDIPTKAAATAVRIVFVLVAVATVARSGPFNWPTSWSLILHFTTAISTIAFFFLLASDGAFLGAFPTTTIVRLSGKAFDSSASSLSE